MTLIHFTSERHVGCLVEWRLDAIPLPEDMHSLERERAKVVDQTGSEAVICVDWRLGEVLRPAVSDALVQAWHKRAIGFRRSAILLSKDRATFNLQIERVLRTCDVENRRSFCDVSKLLEWLSEVLNADELRRAADFLNQPTR